MSPTRVRRANDGFQSFLARRLGSGLLGELIQQCAHDGVTLRLQVLKTNPAQRL
jgi:hypothetical protein